ncbi:hypothetical protein BRADI_1g42449v3 [Brachypodium distachyon]|uniref:Uncharacterized protein n=1 Tax=Brachypodium distachyon TaxID=15368 RepID=A0A0Q3S0G1_BRADI|nr:hypothetical protein BRADI_1g42449v3 [Brachypodium distachyon]
MVLSFPSKLQESQVGKFRANAAAGWLVPANMLVNSEPTLRLHVISLRHMWLNSVCLFPDIVFSIFQ